jgi:hypothetical protein
MVEVPQRQCCAFECPVCHFVLIEAAAFEEPSIADSKSGRQAPPEG